MKKLFVYILSLMCLTCLFGFGCSCGGDEDGETVFEINEKVEMYLGDEFTLTVQTDDETAEVTFVSGDENVVVVSEKGVLRAKSLGETEITATYKGIEKICNVKVIDSGKVPYLKAQNVDDEFIKLFEGDEFKLKPTVFYDGENDCEFSYSVIDGGDYISVSADGVIKAKAKGVGTIKVTCLYKIWDLSCEVKVSVINDITVVLSERELSLSLGTLTGKQSSCTVSLLGVYDNGVKVNDAFVVFESSNDSVASVDGSGKIQAVGIGTTLIKAKYTATSGEIYYGYITVTVSEMKLDSITSLSVSENGILTFDQVVCADRYVITDGNKTFTTSENTFDLNKFGIFGTGVFVIHAETDSMGVADSDEVNFTCDFKSCSLIGALEKKDTHEYALLNNVFGKDVTKDGAIYYTECNSNAITGSYGYMFKKVYFNAWAKNKYGGDGWCNNAFIPEGSLKLYANSKISFWIYAKQKTTIYYATLDQSFMRGEIAEKTVEPYVWTKVSFTISESDCPGVTYLSSTGNFYFHDLRISSAMYELEDYSGLGDIMATNLINVIDDLPSLDELNGTHKFKLDNARGIYDILSATNKGKITNYDKLVDLETKYDENYEVVYTLEDTNLYQYEGYVPSTWEEKDSQKRDDIDEDGLFQEEYSFMRNALCTVGFNDLYGKDITVSVVYSGENRHAVMSYNPDKLKDSIKTCKEIRFMVYNGGTVERKFLHNFGGDGYVQNINLPVGEWTEISVSVADFYAGNRFGIFQCEAGATYKYSAFYAVKNNQADVDNIVNMISGLSDIPVWNESQKIAVIRALYDALPTALQSKITNYEKFAQLETAYTENFKNVYGMVSMSEDGLSEYKDEYGHIANYRCVDDDTYGKVLAFSTVASGERAHAILKTDKTAIPNLTGYDVVHFAVYNPTENEKNFSMKVNGEITKYATLKGNSWTEVSIEVKDFMTCDYFGILQVDLGVMYKYSPFIAEHIIEIDQVAYAKSLITAAKTTDGDSIVTARDYYDGLTVAKKKQVDNYSVLLEKESEYRVIAESATSTDSAVLTLIGKIETFNTNFVTITGSNLNSLCVMQNKIKEIKGEYSAMTAIQKYGVTNYPTFLINISTFAVIEDNEGDGIAQRFIKVVTEGVTNNLGEITNSSSNPEVNAMFNNEEYGHLGVINKSFAGTANLVFDLKNAEYVDIDNYGYVSFALWNGLNDGNIRVKLYGADTETVILSWTAKTASMSFTKVTMTAEQFKNCSIWIETASTCKAGNVWITPIVAHN